MDLFGLLCSQGGICIDQPVNFMICRHALMATVLASIGEISREKCQDVHCPKMPDFIV
jgi:hypothetical protein